jgi:hypothetical protein
MIKNNMDKNGSAAFSAMIIGARRFLSIRLFGAVGAEVVSDGGADGVVAVFASAARFGPSIFGCAAGLV